MAGKQHFRRFLKALAIISVICIVMVVLGLFTMQRILASYGITYSSINFDFPNKIKADTVRIDMPSLNGEVDHVAISLSWSSLWSREVRGEYISVQGASIHYQSSDDSTDNSDEIPLISFNRVNISNSTVEVMIQKDVHSILMNDVYLSGFLYDGHWKMDTLINRDFRYTGKYFTDTDRIQSDVPRASAPLPQVTVSQCDLRDNVFIFLIDSQQYKVSNLNLTLQGVKDSDLSASTLHHISLTYQDTLDIHFALDKLKVNGSDEATISDIRLVLPGARLNVPELHISNVPAFSLSLQSDSSYLETKTIALFFPSVNEFLTQNIKLNLSGGLAYSGNRLMLDHMRFDLADKGTQFTAHGFSGFQGIDDSVSFSLSSVRTTTLDIAAWFNMDLSMIRASAISSDLNIKGTYRKLIADGSMNIDRTRLHFKSWLTQTPGGEHHIVMETSSRIVNASRLFANLSTSVELVNPRINLVTTLGNSGISNLHVSARTDSLMIGDHWLTHPDFAIDYNSKKHVTSLTTSSEGLNLFIETNDDILSPNVRYRGWVESDVPQFTDLSKTAGDLRAVLTGTMKLEKRSQHISLTMDSLHFRCRQSEINYLTHGALTFDWNETDFDFDLNLNGKEIINVTGDTGIVDWLTNTTWSAPIPEIDATLAIQIDSTLGEAFTGAKAALDLERLHITSGSNMVDVELDIPAVRFQDVHGKSIQVTATVVDRAINARLDAVAIENAYTPLENLAITIQTKDKLSELRLQSFLPEIKNSIDANLGLEVLDESYKLIFDERKIQLGDQAWVADRNSIITFDQTGVRNATAILTNADQRVTLRDDNGSLRLDVDSLDIQPLITILSQRPVCQGLLNLHADYSLQDGLLQWWGSIHHGKIDTIQLAAFRFEGKRDAHAIHLEADLANYLGSAQVILDDTDANLHYAVKLDNIDIGMLRSLVPLDGQTFSAEGYASGKVTGDYAQRLSANGFLSFKQTHISLMDRGITFSISGDTIRFDQNRITLHKFKMFDRFENAMSLDGTLDFSNRPVVDLSLNADRFRIFEQNSPKSDWRGSVDIASRIRVTGAADNPTIAGQLNTLPSSSITYVVARTVSLDDREKEINFISRKDSSITKRLQPQHATPTTVIHWDVDLNIGLADITVLLDEIAQDYVRAKASGKLHLYTGRDQAAHLFGKLESKEGSILYDAPMISDLNFKIENAVLNWSGDISQPRITFLGSELFRIAPGEMSSLLPNAKERLPINVLAKVEDRPFDDFNLKFDLSSPNTQVAAWIQTLPGDTRETYALSLLLFGKIDTGNGESGNPTLQAVVSKMNEISRRNIKNADLSFYVDNRNAQQSNDQVGYSLSKAFANKKIRISITGNVDMASSSHSDGAVNVRLDYVLHEDPDIRFTAGRGSEYAGVIDGQIDQSSIGISYLKRFRNFAAMFRKRKKQ